MRTITRSRIAREAGQTMAEYAVALTVITVATVGVFTALSGSITGALSNVVSLSSAWARLGRSVARAPRLRRLVLRE